MDPARPFNMNICIGHFSSRFVLLILTIILTSIAGCAQSAADRPAIVSEPTQDHVLENFRLSQQSDIANEDEIAQVSASKPNQQHAVVDPSLIVEPSLIERIDPIGLDGEVHIGGSRTVHPLTREISNLFISDGFRNRIDIEDTTIENGFDRFCRTGDFHIVHASRLMSKAENEHCLEHGKSPIAFKIAYDRIVLLKHARNFWLDGLTSERIELILDAERWSEVDNSWPERPLVHLFPQARGDSTTVFNAYLAKKKIVPIRLSRTNIHFYQFEQELLRDISLDENSIGLTSYRNYMLKSMLPLQLLPLDGFNAQHSQEEGARYPLEQLLYIYSDINTLKNEPQVAAFIAYYLSQVNAKVYELGFFPISQETLAAERSKFLSKVGRIDTE